MGRRITNIKEKNFLSFLFFFYCKSFSTEGSQDNVMSRLEAGRSVFQIPVGGSNFFSSRKSPDRPWAQPVFPGCKAAEAWDWALTSIRCWGLERVELCLHSYIRLHGVYRENSTFTFPTEWTNSVENQVRKVFEFIHSVFRPLYETGNGVGVFLTVCGYLRHYNR
jgi:hypothetical protein